MRGAYINVNKNYNNNKSTTLVQQCVKKCSEVGGNGIEWILYAHDKSQDIKYIQMNLHIYVHMYMFLAWYVYVYVYEFRLSALNITLDMQVSRR